MNSADIAAMRMANQRISAGSFTRPEEAVHWLVPSQAQDYAASKWALGLRLRGASDETIENAYNEGRILRTHVLRPTWHYVTPADIRWLLELTGPRVQAGNAGIYRRMGLDESALRKNDELLARALEGGRQLTREELFEALRAAGVKVDGDFMRGYFLMHAELEGVICSGARRGKQFTYALLEERARGARRLSRPEALVELSRRYFASRGPATVHDLAKWSGLTVSDARSGLGEAKSQFQMEIVDGREYWYDPSRPPAQEEGPRAHLLSIYDEYISAYKDHRHIADAETQARLVGLGNALAYIVVLDGRIAGTFRRVLGKQTIQIQIESFKQFNNAERREIGSAAERMSVFLGLRLEDCSISG